MYDFSVDSNVVNIHKYLIKKTLYKIMFGLSKNICIGLSTSTVNASNHVKCISLTNQKCMTQPTRINLHPNEYRQELRYYLFEVKLDRCAESCNTQM